MGDNPSENIEATETKPIPTKPQVSIASIKFSGGQEFSFLPNEKILVVGPNKSGKSEFLREVVSILSWQNTQIRFERNKVIKNLDLHKSGTADDLLNFMLHHGRAYQQEVIDYQSYRINIQHIQFFANKFLGPLAQLFCKNLGAEGRLAITNVQQGPGADGQRSKPQQLMYDSEALTERVSELFKRAFNKELFFDYRSIPDIPVYVGNLANRETYPDRVSDKYVQEVRKNPRLDKQGDGMRSYAGILFEVIAVEHDITLLDEPEAFLHPPQMRRLGETLAEETLNQVFVATHSSDILRGFLNGTNGRVRIIRLQREGDFNNATMTSPERLNELWEQPELRYSNALDGIFHEEVLICEDDSDCRLYNSIADHLSREFPDKVWPDTAYVPCGGKAAIPKITQALMEIGVPVKIVSDLDLLNDGVMLRGVIESLGGNWADFETHWRQLDAAVRDGVKPLSNSEVFTEIKRIMDEHEGDGLPKSEIQNVLKQTSPWAMVKKHGKSVIPRGDAQATFALLDGKLRALGVFLVAVGEAENFCPDVGLHGPRFVAKLFRDHPLDSPKLEALRDFVAGIFGHGPKTET